MNIDEFSLLQLPTEENQDFEFKSSLSKLEELKKKLGCAVSGFANSGGGTFVAGVADNNGNADGGIPLQIEKQGLREWADQIIYNVKPTPIYQLKLIINPDDRGYINSDKAVLLVSVEESHNAPHMAPDGRYYIRAGVHTTRAPQYIVEALWAKRHFAKPRLTHLIRQKPDYEEIIQIGVIALTDSPAIDVELNMLPLPGVIRDHACREFPVSIGIIDKHTPFFFDIATRRHAEENQQEEFDLILSYSDLASNRYTYKSEPRINLFRAIPSLRFHRKGLHEIATTLESIVLQKGI